MTNVESWEPLTAEERDRFLSACEAGWDAAEDWKAHSGRLWRVIIWLAAMLTMTNAGWIGGLFLAAYRMGVKP